MPCRAAERGNMALLKTKDEQRAALFAVLMSSIGLLVTLKTGPTAENVITMLILIAAAMIGGLAWSRYDGWIGRFVVIESCFAIYFGISLKTWDTMLDLIFSVILATAWLLYGWPKVAVILALEAVAFIYFGWGLSQHAVGIAVAVIAVFGGLWNSEMPRKPAKAHA